MYSIRLLVGVIVVLCVGVVAFAAAPLEKSKWRVELKVDGSGAPQFIDRLTFEDKNLTSVIFERKKFLPSSYSSSPKGEDGLAWESKQKSETDGELTWKGELQGDTMTGTLDWKDLDGKTTKYTIYGTPVVEEVVAGAEGAAQAGGEKATGSESAPGAKKSWGCSFVPSSSN